MANDFSAEFIEALKDYFFLLEKKYQQDVVHTLVCERYGLTSIQSDILLLGVFTLEKVAERKNKLTDRLDADILAIDAYNVIRTIANYFLKHKIFICFDDMIRDTEGLHKDSNNHDIIVCAVSALVRFLSNYNPLPKLLFYIDTRMTTSDFIERVLLEQLKMSSLHAEVLSKSDITCSLICQSNAIISTSNIQIIDQTESRIFDLACEVMFDQFNPEFIDLRTLADYNTVLVRKTIKMYF